MGSSDPSREFHSNPLGSYDNPVSCKTTQVVRIGGAAMTRAQKMAQRVDRSIRVDYAVEVDTFLDGLHDSIPDEEEFGLSYDDLDLIIRSTYLGYAA